MDLSEQEADLIRLLRGQDAASFMITLARGTLARGYAPFTIRLDVRDGTPSFAVGDSFDDTWTSLEPWFERGVHDEAGGANG